MGLQIPQVTGSERKTMIALEPMMSAVWARLKRYAPWPLRLDFQHVADTPIYKRSSAVSLLPGCRPGSHVIIDQRLCMDVEYKVIGLSRLLCSQV